MKLTDILDEISIGFQNNDAKSKKIRGHVERVRTVLESPDVVFANRSLNFIIREKGEAISLSGSQVFLQGSYAISTAIKHATYEVDADIAFYIDEVVDDRNIRIRIFENLKKKLGAHEIKIKKPCITIDFGDGYKVDIAVYSKSTSNDTMMFHNSISGSEEKTIATPKVIISTFSEYLKGDEFKRPILRLTKHFIKNSTDKLRIEEDNKIPSIALLILAIERYQPNNLEFSEETLNAELNRFVDVLKNEFIHNQRIDVSCKSLLISNTLYKVNDFEQVRSVINEISIQTHSKNYAALISKNIFDSVNKRSKSDPTPSMLGTMGNVHE